MSEVLAYVSAIDVTDEVLVLTMVVIYPYPQG
jgi:hypothetical protein